MIEVDRSYKPLEETFPRQKIRDMTQRLTRMGKTGASINISVAYQKELLKLSEVILKKVGPVYVAPS